LYQKVNGNLDGLEEKLAVAPKTSPDTIAVFVQKPETNQKPETTRKPNKKVPDIVPIAKATPQILPKKTEENKTVPEKIPDPTPIPTVAADNSETTSTKTETTIEKLTLPIPIESNDVKKSLEDKVKTSTIENSTTEKSAEDTTKPLFEPIIIEVPKPDIKKYKKSVEAAKTKKTETTTENSETNTKTTNLAGTTRQRIVVLKNDEITECEISVSQEVVSIINDGGNLGVLVGLKDRNDPKNIKAVSGSPKDIQVIYEPEIGGVAGQAFFLVKSISQNKGAFTVTFDTPCGKKEILVKVR
ncbi:MAG: hypothetical protein ACR2J3_02850, partial [Aridibacter sp.]